MPAIIISFFKIAWPYIAAALVVFGVWLAGCQHVQRQWDAREAQLQAESNQQLLAAHDHNARLQQSLQVSAKIIGDSYDQHQTEITDLADRNRQLLADRLRIERAGSRCSAMSIATGATRTSHEPAAGTDAFLAGAGASLIAESARADAVSESLRACQSWIAAVQHQFNSK